MVFFICLEEVGGYKIDDNYDIKIEKIDRFADNVKFSTGDKYFAQLTKSYLTTQNTANYASYDLISTEQNIIFCVNCRMVTKPYRVC